MEDTPSAATPPQFGFVIDHRKCIGCHACTVACKAENEVPVGKFRTWVKYTEKGTFPAVKRHFTVLRCNHCDAAPCVTICPVNALSKRLDAIVDLDRDACIGCRACMQACPYDAIYLNEDTGTAEKCHYCAHRTERGLEPACVVVCPERAIIPGDVSNPTSEIAIIIREQDVKQRKLEKGTKPRVWYVDALPESLTPGVAQEPTSYLWSDRKNQPPTVPTGFEPPDDLISVLDVDHAPVWGWHIWVYLLTKNLAAGAMLLAPLTGWLGVDPASMTALVPEAVGLLFLGVTMFLLVHDLGRPERFLRILLTPNTKSWLVKGAWVLAAFGGATIVALVARLLDAHGIADLARYVNLPFAALAAGYSAWLFKQCHGRDLWIEAGLFQKLVLRAGLLGAALGGTLARSGDAGLLVGAVYVVLLGALLYYEHRPMERTHDGAKAHAILVQSGVPRAAAMLMLAAAGLLLVAGFLAGAAAIGAAVLAVLLTIAGQLIDERAWVRAGQEVPLS